MKPPANRLFVLLAAYERLSGRQRSALRRGEIAHALDLGQRALRVAEAMRRERQSAELPEVEKAAFHERVRTLEKSDRESLEILAEHQARVGAGLQTLHMTARRTRQVRRGYGHLSGPHSVRADTILGSA